MSEETKTISLILPLADYNAIVQKLKPLESVQDFIRTTLKEKLSEVKE